MLPHVSDGVEAHIQLQLCGTDIFHPTCCLGTLVSSHKLCITVEVS
jgi:hypothetical protein